MDKDNLGYLDKNKTHFDACHERWMIKRNRDPNTESYPERWNFEQCFACRYYVRLMGLFADDWGACSNQFSPFDGIVRFEHDGCDYFVSAFSPEDPSEKQSA